MADRDGSARRCGVFFQPASPSQRSNRHRGAPGCTSPVNCHKCMTCRVCAACVPSGASRDRVHRRSRAGSGRWRTASRVVAGSAAAATRPRPATSVRTRVVSRVRAVVSGGGAPAFSGAPWWCHFSYQCRESVVSLPASGRRRQTPTTAAGARWTCPTTSLSRATSRRTLTWRMATCRMAWHGKGEHDFAVRALAHGHASRHAC